MITFDNVTKYYKGGSITALDGVNLVIEEGDFVYLVGQSGAGKTTLFKLLIRDEVPSQGDIWFWEQNIVRLPKRKVADLRRKVGLIFQDFKLLQQLTVSENIAFAMEVLGKRSHEVKQRVPELLNLVGLEDRANFFPRELSTGEQQRVAIARTLANEPEVLLADEPTGNLDKKNAKQIVSLLKDINERGTTVIMATHDVELTKQSGVRVLEVSEGKLKELTK